MFYTMILKKLFKKGEVSMSTIIIITVAVISLLLIIIFMTKQADKGGSLLETLGGLFSGAKR